MNNQTPNLQIHSSLANDWRHIDSPSLSHPLILLSWHTASGSVKGLKWPMLLATYLDFSWLQKVNNNGNNYLVWFLLYRSMFILQQPTGVWGKYLDLQFRIFLYFFLLPFRLSKTCILNLS